MRYGADMNQEMIDLPVRRLGLGEPGDADLTRSIAIEAPVSIEVGGIGYAVMMATPADLDDYAVGFALGEGLVENADQIGRIDAHLIEGGWALRIWLPPERNAIALERARKRVSESSCGLCGIENIEQVLRPLSAVTARIATDRSAIAAALAALRDHQPLGRATGAVHAAAFCSPDGAVRLAREDVGRHNALDKLIGALAALDADASQGAIIVTSRASYEMVQKAASAGVGLMAAISAPTALAVRLAQQCNMTLIGFARENRHVIYTHPHRIT